MKKILLPLLSAALVSTIALADNVGGCGVGSKIFDGQTGVAPQVLAVTTNGILGNQTFGISSGTLGCSQKGVVRSQWASNKFIDSNMTRLAKDMSRGNGESLVSLASLLNVAPADRTLFMTTLQNHFDEIFTDPEVPSNVVAQNIHQVLQNDKALVRYSNLV
jgi:hypothetical protein